MARLLSVETAVQVQDLGGVENDRGEVATGRVGMVGRVGVVGWVGWVGWVG
jgi:hypothetical protein